MDPIWSEDNPWSPRDPMGGPFGSARARRLPAELTNAVPPGKTCMFDNLLSFLGHLYSFLLTVFDQNRDLAIADVPPQVFPSHLSERLRLNRYLDGGSTQHVPTIILS